MIPWCRISTCSSVTSARSLRSVTSAGSSRSQSPGPGLANGGTTANGGVNGGTMVNGFNGLTTANGGTMVNGLSTGLSIPGVAVVRRDRSLNTVIPRVTTYITSCF